MVLSYETYTQVVEGSTSEKTYERLEAKIDAMHREFLERSVRAGTDEQGYDDARPLTEDEIQEALARRRRRDNRIRRRDQRLIQSESEGEITSLTKRSAVLTF